MDPNNPNDPTLPPNVHPFPPRPGAPGGPSFIPGDMPPLPDFLRMFGGSPPGAHAETPEQATARVAAERAAAELESERLAARCAQELHNVRQIVHLACSSGAKITVQGITVDPPAPPTPLDRTLANLIRTLTQALQPDLRQMPLVTSPAEDPVTKFLFSAAQAGLVDKAQNPEARKWYLDTALAYYEVCKVTLSVGDPRWGQIAPIRVALEPRPAPAEPQDAQRGEPGSAASDELEQAQARYAAAERRAEAAQVNAAAEELERSAITDPTPEQVQALIGGLVAALERDPGLPPIARSVLSEISAQISPPDHWSRRLLAIACGWLETFDGADHAPPPIEVMRAACDEIGPIDQKASESLVRIMAQATEKAATKRPDLLKRADDLIPAIRAAMTAGGPYFVRAMGQFLKFYEIMVIAAATDF